MIRSIALAGVLALCCPSIVFAANQPPDTPPSQTQAGLAYQFYLSAGASGVLPDFTQLQPSKTGIVTNFDLSPRTTDYNISFQYTGYVTVPTDGSYTFYTTSDDGSRLYIGSTSPILVVDNNYAQGMTERSGPIDLAAGKHALTVQWAQGGGGFGLEVRYQGPGITKQLIPDSALSCIPLPPPTPRPPDNPSGTVQGLLYKFYTTSGSGGTLPDFTTITPAKVGTINNFLLDPRTTDNNISFEYTGYVTIPTTDTWTFYTTSDDGSRLFIGSTLVVENNYSQGATERFGSILLAAGVHAIKVQWGQGGGGFSLAVSYASTTLSERAIPDSALWYRQMVATPVISCNGTAVAPQATVKLPPPTFSLSLSCTTPTAVIRYTTDGTTPTTSSTVYTTPVTLTVPTSGVPLTVKALATATNYDNSFVALANVASSNPPPNDSFSAATVIPQNATLPYTVSGGNYNATWENGEPDHGGGGGHKSIWYSWVAPAAGTYMLSTAGSTAADNSEMDTVLAVYTGSVVNALTLLAQNDDASPSTKTSLVAFATTMGTTYRIAADGYDGAEGNVQLKLSQGPIVSVIATTPSAYEAGAVNGVFTISRVGTTAGDLMVYMSLSGSADHGADYKRLDVDNYVIIYNGQSSATVTITPIDDLIIEGPETVILTLLPDAAYTINPAHVSGTVTITDNDTGSGQVADTKWSVHRGFYTGAIDVAITTDTAGASIRYTTDGTMPTPTYGTLYTVPVHVTGTTTLRAMAYKSGMTPTDVDTQTYIYTADVIHQSPDGSTPAGWPSTWGGNAVDYGMDPDIVNSSQWGSMVRPGLASPTSIRTLCMSIKLGDLFDPSTGIYANAGNDGYAWERAGNLELLDPATPANNWGALCGVRIRGGYSRSSSNPKHAFRIFFRKDWGKGSLDFTKGDLALVSPLFGADGQKKIDKFDIRCDQNYSWSFEGNRGAECFMRDNFSRFTQLAMSGMGTRGDYFHLYIDGQYWGLFNVEERPEQSFSANYFGGDKDNYDVIKTSGDTGYTIYATNGDLKAWTRLWKQCKAGLSSNTAYYLIQGRNPDGTVNPAYENLLEVDQLIDYMLVMYFGGNLDSPISAFLGNAGPNNIFFSRDRTGAHGGFRFITHDAEHTLLNLYENRLGPFSAGDTLDRSNPQWVFQQCMANSEFRLKVADHVRKHFFDGGALTPAACTARFRNLMSQLDNAGASAVVGESARWGDSRLSPPGSRDDWLAVCNGILNSYFNATPKTRTQVVLEQLMAANLYPSSLSAPTFSPYGGTVDPGTTCTITNPNASTVVYYTTDGTDPRVLGGGIAPTAVASSTTSTSVVLNGTVTLQARVLSGSTWSALTTATITVLQDLSALHVTEVMYNPPEGPQFAFIELKNTGSTALDLKGASFTAGISYTFPNPSMVNAGQFVVLVKDPTSFTSKYPGVTQFGTYTGQLSTTGGTITLSYASGATVFSFQYGVNPPWPVTAAGLGFSLVPADASAAVAYGNPAYWRVSANLGGSPGADDPAPSSTLGKILINEALTHATLPTHEYIELYNAGSSQVNISGWYLTDDRHTPLKFRIPDATPPLAAGAYVSFFDDTQYGASFEFSSHGGEVYVFSADPGTHALTGYAHGFSFGAAENPVAFGRYVISTGAEHFVAQATNTPGAANSLPRVGPVVINKVMYQPAAGGYQFIELLNTTSNTVNLYDPANPWKISGVNYTFDQGIQIAPMGLLVVCGINPPSVFRTLCNVPEGVQVVGPWSTSLSTTGMHIELQKPDSPDAGYVPYIVVEALDYASTAPWPLAAGNGPCLQRKDTASYGNDPTNWRQSSSNGGTPGQSELPVPAAPTNLSAAAQSATVINLVWTDNAFNETSYTVERSLDGVSNWTALLPLGADVSSYRDFGLTPSTKYYYRVHASNPGGDSSAAIANATTQPPPPPSQPQNTTVTPYSQSKLQVDWYDASDNETGFKIERSPDGQSGWFEITRTAANATAYIDLGLQPLTTYYYRVRAFNSSGNSDYDAASSGTTQQPRILRLRPANPLVRSHKGSVFVDLDSVGGENSVAFSMAFNTNVLSNPVVLLGVDSGADVTLSQQSTPGYIGATLTWSDSGFYGKGVKTIAEIRFDVAPSGGVGSTPVNFADHPVARSVKDFSSVSLEIGYQGATASIGLNTAPVAHDGTLTVTENGGPQPGTLHAFDAEGDTLTYSIVSYPALGTVEITDAVTGEFSYTPNLGAHGADSFTFEANDGLADSNAATVSVGVLTLGANTPPVVSGDSLTMAQDASYSGTLHASDADGDTLALSIVRSPAHGTVNITDVSTGLFTYTPNANVHGSDSFTFEANDGQADSNVATVSVAILKQQGGNTPPVAHDYVGTLTVTENTAVSDTLAATDTNGDTLTYSIVGNPALGAVIITNPSTGAFTYTPNANAHGSDSFTFKATDGVGDSNVATVSIAVIKPGPNSAPVVSGDSLTMAQGASKSGNLAFSDADGDTLALSIVRSPAHGTVNITNVSTGAFTYTPNAAWNGSDSFTFKANDGLADSNVATVSITVRPTPARPMTVVVTFTIPKSVSIAWGQSTTGKQPGEVSDLAWTVKGANGNVLGLRATCASNDPNNSIRMEIGNTSSTNSNATVSGAVTDTGGWSIGSTPAADTFVIQAQLGTNPVKTLTAAQDLTDTTALAKGADQELIVTLKTPTSVTNGAGVQRTMAVTLTATPK